MTQETSFLNDTNFWYGVALVTFLALIAKTAGKGILGGLDAQIAKIRSDLDEAKRLRAEAESALEMCRARQDEALREAETIVADAKSLAAKIRKEAEIELEEMLRRHEQMAIDRIRAAQEDAVEEVRAHVLRQAFIEARGKLAKDIAGAKAAELVESSIVDLKGLLRKK